MLQGSPDGHLLCRQTFGVVFMRRPRPPGLHNHTRLLMTLPTSLQASLLLLAYVLLVQLLLYRPLQSTFKDLHCVL